MTNSFIEKDYLENITYLINKNIKFDLDDNIINLSCKYGYLNIIKYIVENKFNIKYEDYFLEIAIKNNHLDIIKYLIENKANIDVDDYICLLFAFENKNFEMCKILIENRADYKQIFYKLYFYFIEKNDFLIYLIYYLLKKLNTDNFININFEIFDNFRINNKTNIKSKLLYDNYQLLKKELINKVNLINYV